MIRKLFSESLRTIRGNTALIFEIIKVEIIFNPNPIHITCHMYTFLLINS